MTNLASIAQIERDLIGACLLSSQAFKVCSSPQWKITPFILRKRPVDGCDSSY